MIATTFPFWWLAGVVVDVAAAKRDRLLVPCMQQQVQQHPIHDDDDHMDDRFRQSNYNIIYYHIIALERV